MRNKIFFIFLFVCLLIQITFPNFLKIIYIKCDLIVILVSFYLVYFDYRRVYPLVLFSSIVKDYFTTLPFGMSIISYALLIYTSYRLKNIFHQRKDVVVYICVSICPWINLLLLAFFSLIGLRRFNTFMDLFITIAESLYNLAITIIAVYIIKKCALKKFTFLQSLSSY